MIDSTSDIIENYGIQRHIPLNYSLLYPDFGNPRYNGLSTMLGTKKANKNNLPVNAMKAYGEVE
jgi:hypothetical protein